MKTFQLVNYACQCNVCGEHVDASRINVTVDYGDFYDAAADELAHVEGVYVECDECVEG